MITTIRRGEVYHFATMDPAVLDERRDIEWSEHHAAMEKSDSERAADSRLLAALRRLLGRETSH